MRVSKQNLGLTIHLNGSGLEPFSESVFLPLGSFPPKTVNFCGFWRNSTTSCSSFLASSTPFTCSKVTFFIWTGSTAESRPDVVRNRTVRIIVHIIVHTANTHTKHYTELSQSHKKGIKGASQPSEHYWFSNQAKTFTNDSDFIFTLVDMTQGISYTEFRKTNHTCRRFYIIFT